MGRKSASRPADSVLVPRQILVGVDFGTTYSGVAWAQTARVSRKATSLFELHD